MTATSGESDKTKDVPKKDAPAPEHAEAAKGANDKLQADAASKPADNAAKTDASKSDTGKPGETKAADGVKSADTPDAKKDSHDGHEHHDGHEQTPAEKLSAEAMQLWREAAKATKDIFGVAIPKGLNFDAHKKLDMSGGKETPRLFGDLALTGDLTAKGKLEVPPVKAASADKPPEAAKPGEAPKPVEPTKPGEIAKAGDETKPATDKPAGWLDFAGKSLNWAESKVEGGWETLKTAWRGAFDDTASKALAKDDSTSEKSIAEASKNKDITITSERYVPTGDVKQVSMQAGDVTHTATKDTWVRKGADGITITKDKVNGTETIQKEGGETLTRYKDGHEVVKRADGTEVTKFKDGHVEVVNPEKGTKTRLDGKDVTQYFPEFTIRQTARKVVEDAINGKARPEPGACTIGSDGTVCSNNEGTSVVSNDNKVVLLSKTEAGSLVYDPKTETFTRNGADGKPIPGQEHMTREQWRRQHGREDFGGFHARSRDGKADVQSQNGAIDMAYNDKTKTPDLKLTVQNGEQKGDTINVTTQGTRTNYVFADQSGKPIKESSVDPSDDKHIYNEKGIDPKNPDANFNYSYDPQKGFVFGAYNDAADTQPDFDLCQNGPDFFQGYNIDPDGSVWEDNGYGGKTYDYYADNDSFGPGDGGSYSEASSVSSSSQSVAGRVLSAADNPSPTFAAQFIGDANNALSNIDQCIAQVMSGRDWSMVGNLIASKDAVISAKCALESKMSNLSDATSKGLTGDKASEAAEYAEGGMSIQTAIKLAKERQAGRIPMSWT